MKKYTVLSLVAMSCLSCNPIVVQPDAGTKQEDAGNSDEVSTHIFQPQNILIAKAK